MNRKLAIDGFQFYCTVYLFEMGTSSLIGLSESAKQDAWISVMISTIIGIFLFYIYLKLNEFYPDLSLIQYVHKIVGKYPGKVLGIIYIIYFIYIAGRDLRDFEELLVNTLFNSSSLISIGILMMFLILYTVYKGFEPFARGNEILFFLTNIFVFTVIGFEIISHVINLDNLKPILENGWKPVFKAAFPETVTYPFGEVVAFTMFIKYVNRPEIIMKSGLSSLATAGFILTLFTIKNIAILGVSTFERATYPTLTAVSFVNIANFVTRFDPIIIMLMVLGGFVKISVFFFCAISGASDYFNVKQSEKLVYPIGVIIVLISVLMASNFVAHYREGLKFVPYFLHIPLQMVIPIFLLIIVLIKRKINTNSK